MTDDEIIKRRLLIDGDGTGETRITSKFVRTFVKWSSTDESAAESQLQHDRLLAQLSNLEGSYCKWSHIINMNTEEQKYYDKLKDETKVSVHAARDTLGRTQSALLVARERRRERREYAALTKLIQEHPPRAHSDTRLDAIKLQLKNIKSKREYLEHQLHCRRNQLHSLVTCLNQLRESLSDGDSIKENFEGEAKEALNVVDLTTEDQSEGSLMEVME